MLQLVVDEVYHPIYRRSRARSAGGFTRATILGDSSKAFSLSGIRVGWVLERDKERREDYWNARANFSISNNFPGELLAEVAVRNREKIFDRAREVSAKNLARALDVKSVAPCRPEVADRHSGYQVGGTSPFGLKRPMPVYAERSVLELPTLYINGGARGFLVGISPRDLERVLSPGLVEVAIP